VPGHALQTISVRLYNQSDFMEALKAALSEEVLRVRLAEPPPQREKLILEITGRTVRVLVGAEVAGAMFEGAWPLRLRPTSEEQFGELFAIIARLEAERHANPASEPEDPLEAELMLMGAAMPEEAPAELEELGPATPASFPAIDELPWPANHAEDTMTPVVRPSFGNAQGTSILALPDEQAAAAAAKPKDSRPNIQFTPPSASRIPIPRDDSDDDLFSSDPTMESEALPDLDFDDATLERKGVSVETLAPDPLLDRKVANGKYEIESLVGSGASGAVYKAKHIGLRRAVAIKVLHPHFQADPEFMKRFHREALAASQLDHLNIMRVLDFGQEGDGLVYIVMEYLSGSSLAARLHEEGKFEPDRAVATVSQVLSALAVAHEQGIIHRDVKPENIVIVKGRDEDGGAIEVVKVCDFGIAALQNTHPDDPTPRAMEAAELAKSIGGGYLCGTPEYMAPEQARGEVTDPRSDVYACACTLYELLTGKTPFEGMGPMEIIVAQATMPVPEPSRIVPVPPELEAVIMRALSKLPEDRPQNARQFRTELREALEASAPKPQKKTPSLVQRGTGSQPAFDVEAGLSAFTMFFASAVLGTGGFRKENKKTFATQWKDGQKLLSSLLEVRREMTFVRRDTERAIGFFVLLGDGEAIDLKKLFGREGYEKVGALFVNELARPGVAALTLSREATDVALSDLVSLLGQPPEDAARGIAAGKLTGISAIFPSEIAGRDRKLAWKVGLSASRLARDLALLQRSGVNPTTMAEATQELVLRSVRVLTKAEELRQLLVNIDLAAARGARVEGLAAQMTSALPLSRCLDVTAILVSDLDQKEGSDRERSAGLLGLVGRRLVRERTPEMFEILCDLGVRGLISLQELPDDIAQVIRAEQLADTLARSPDKYLAMLTSPMDDAAFQAALTILKGALKILAKRGESTAVLSSVTTLARIASNKGQTGTLRERLAFKVITSAVAEERLVPMANVLMLGQPHAREAAKQLLSLAGEAGARALVRARTTLREPNGRPYFIQAMKETGHHGSAVIAKTLAHIDIVKDGTDLTVVEDLLRGVPVRPDSALATEISRFMRHRTLRAVALYAYAEVSGDRARELVMETLEHADESMRASALFATVRLNQVDETVISSVEKLLSRPGVGEPVRRAAVTALGSALPGAPRARAVNLLSRLVEGKAGLLSKLRAGEAPPEEPMLVLDAARSLLALDRSEGIGAIVQRQQRASRELKTGLERLIEGTNRIRS
jgi:serine/threonine-protein kinase